MRLLVDCALRILTQLHTTVRCLCVFFLDKINTISSEWREHEFVRKLCKGDGYKNEACFFFLHIYADYLYAITQHEKKLFQI